MHTCENCKKKICDCGSCGCPDNDECICGGAEAENEDCGCDGEVTVDEDE